MNLSRERGRDRERALSAAQVYNLCRLLCVWAYALCGRRCPSNFRVFATLTFATCSRMSRCVCVRMRERERVTEREHATSSLRLRRSASAVLPVYNQHMFAPNWVCVSFCSSLFPPSTPPLSFSSLCCVVLSCRAAAIKSVARATSASSMRGRGRGGNKSICPLCFDF